MDKEFRNSVKVILQWLGLFTLLGTFFGKAGFQVVNVDYRITLFMFVFCFILLVIIEGFAEE